MCYSWDFHSAYSYLIRAGKKYACYLYTLWKVHIFLGETQNGMKKTCFLSLNIQYKTR